MFVIPIAVTVYALIDALLAPGVRIRLLPKAVWVFVIVVLPLVGAVLWFGLGRPLRGSGGGSGSGSGPGPGRSGVIGPDDDPGFLRSLRDRKPR